MFTFNRMGPLKRIYLLAIVETTQLPDHTYTVENIPEGRNFLTLTATACKRK